MSPKKAIIIILILSALTIGMFFSVYYLKKWASGVNQSELNKSGNQEINSGQPVNPSDTLEQKIDRIIEDAKNSPAQLRQNIVEAINNEIIEQEQNKTAEQKAADLEAQENRQKAIDQINSQIKQ